MRRRPLLVAWLGMAIAAVAASPALRAQALLDATQELDFDRPESWAMAWFGSIARASPLGAGTLEPGQVELALEGGWVPHLDAEQRRVGFLGDKEEDLNRTSAFGRLRLAAGLGGRFEATLGWVPPVEFDGLEPNIVTLGVRRPLAEGQRWRLDGGLSGQWGRIEGDITCPREAAAAGDDAVRNPLHCRAPSEDEMTVGSWGGELIVSRRPATGSLVPYLALLATRFDNTFEVRARHGQVLEIVDRSRLEADGLAWAGAAGLDLHLGADRRTRAALEIFYSPLDVVRETGEPAQRDELLNVRVLLGRRLR